jgi:pimeloyl-ACP methyl ester carboxylesterase
MLAGLPETDAKFFRDPSWLELMYGSMAEAFRQEDEGVKAVLQEHQFFMKPWAEPISFIPPGKVWIWHGTEDNTCRVENAHITAKAVPNAQLEVFRGEGHCVLFDNIEKLHETLSPE